MSHIEYVRRRCVFSNVNVLSKFSKMLFNSIRGIAMIFGLNKTRFQAREFFVIHAWVPNTTQIIPGSVKTTGEVSGKCLAP